MSKKLNNPENTSVLVYVKNISPRGVWMLAGGKEYFISFVQFPDFFKATIEQICTVHFFRGKEFYWLLLDISIDLDSIKDLETRPLKYYS